MVKTIDPLNPPVLQGKKHLPALTTGNWKPTSYPCVRYNCIAWAAGDDSRWWWPADQGYWPPDAPKELTLQAFLAAFATLGYHQCGGAHLEEGFEKVALYSKGGIPTHAARQLRDGFWTSKMGRDADISHKLLGVCGKIYGEVAVYLRRPLPVLPSPQDAPSGSSGSDQPQA